MTERRRKIFVAAGVLLLLLPLTLATALLVFVSYPAYPLAEYRLLQFAFDLGMLLQLPGIGSAWGLAVMYLRTGPNGLRRARLSLALFSAAAMVGLVGAAIALWHFLNPESAPVYVGFALFAPAAFLVPMWIYLLWERRRATSAENTRRVEGALRRG